MSEAKAYEPTTHLNSLSPLISMLLLIGLKCAICVQNAGFVFLANRLNISKPHHKCAFTAHYCTVTYARILMVPGKPQAACVNLSQEAEY